MLVSCQYCILGSVFEYLNELVEKYELAHMQKKTGMLGDCFVVNKVFHMFQIVH
jgi:hypothetical protein